MEKEPSNKSAIPLPPATLTHDLRGALAPIGAFLKTVDTSAAAPNIRELHAAACRAFDRIKNLLK